MSVECISTSLELPDGTVLVADLWRPVTQTPCPALLMRQPYGRSIASTVTLPHPSWWVSHGFMVMIQDVRGQGDSGGSFRGFTQEAADMAATLSWLRRRADCNGLVGCYGFSYQGLTQLLATPDTPPPNCMAPAMAGLDERHHWSCEGGAHWWHLGLGWGLQLAALQAQRRGDHRAWLEIRRSLDSGCYLQNGAELIARHDPDGMANRWMQQDPTNDRDWTVHTVPTSWLKQPMLLIGGWWDPHLLGVLDLWQRSRQAGGRPELHIGPATHLQWWPEAQHLLLHFFNRYLKDNGANTPDPTEPRTLLWNLTDQSWDNLEPTEADTWHLRGDPLATHDHAHGALLRNSSGHGRVCIVHDPWRAVPAIGGHLSPTAGPADRRAIDERGDVATFTSEPLTQPLTLQGQPRLSVEVSADQAGFDLCVALSRLPQHGDDVEQLSTGVMRVRGENARQRSPRCVRLQPLLATLPKGDRLRLSIAGAAWPAIGVNSGSTSTGCGAPGMSHRVITMTLHLAGSHLTLIPLNSGRLTSDRLNSP